MFGTVLSTITKVVTLPVDAVEYGLDKVDGGDGSKESRKTEISETRDDICDAMEDMFDL